MKQLPQNVVARPEHPTQAAGTVKSISQTATEEFPDGIEILGDGTKTYGFTIASPDWVSATSTAKVYVSAFGYEY